MTTPTPKPLKGKQTDTIGKNPKLKPAVPDADKAFFDDIDHLNSRPGCCGVQAVWWLSLIVLIVLVLVIWKFVHPFTSSSQNITGGDGGSFSLQIPSSSADATKQTYTVHLLDDQLNQLLAEQSITNVTGLSGQIHADAMVLRGTYHYGVSAPIVIKLIPQVQNGQVVVQINDLTIAGIRVMPLANDAVRSSLNQTLEQYIQHQFSGTLTRITLEEGKLTAYLVP